MPMTNYIELIQRERSKVYATSAKVPTGITMSYTTYCELCGYMLFVTGDKHCNNLKTIFDMSIDIDYLNIIPVGTFYITVKKTKRMIKCQKSMI